MSIKITALTHDLLVKKSFVRLVWENDPNQSLGLEVPFGCGLEELSGEAERAVRALSDELRTIEVLK
ncbi:hypothetical protein [Flaviflagellibacter deserti]|uniref:Uncharacterized protein n=1 Tax=Flaviflagellibacter deserti TaxID=2267266 RepID=A0ABV9YUJ5_9HYPH